MKSACCRASFIFVSLVAGVMLTFVPRLGAEQVPLKRIVELALTHSTAAGAAAADEKRALASYLETRNQYFPQLVVGAGLGASWGFPLSLEGSAPSLLNVNAQSALLNPSLRDFVRAAKTEWQASTLQGKDQRNQLIQDAVLTYAELAKWEALAGHLEESESEAVKMEEIVKQRISAGVDSPMAQDQARLTAARAHLRITEAQGSIDVLRNRLSQMTGLAAGTIETDADSIPPLPEINSREDIVGKAMTVSPAVKAADTRAEAQDFRARGEHRALWPSVDFAAQYALLSRYNNYDEFYNSFQRHNATIGVAIRFPFLNFSQHARADAADAESVRVKKDAQAAKNQVSEETLKLQRSVDQLAAAQEVADLEYRIANSNLEATQVKIDAGTLTMHDLDDARSATAERYSALQDANFQLERARIALLRTTGDLETWLGIAK